MKKTTRNVVGAQIRQLRTAANLTQDAMAARCGVAGWDVSRGTLAKIEAEVRCVNDAELFLLARVLKCDLTALFPKDAAVVLRSLG